MPIELKAETYATNGKSPRGNRFLGSFRQFVRHDGGTKLDTKPACLVDEEALKQCASNEPGPKILESPELADIIEEIQSK